MAEVNPPLFVDTDEVYGADELALPFRDLVGEGVVETGDLLVAQRAAGANMSVDVAGGAAWVKGDSEADLQPTYRVFSDGVVNLAISAADATNPRIDLVVAQMKDSTFSGTSDAWELLIVEGTPAATPAAPALPDSALLLAQVNVAAAAASITTADITDSRPRASVGGGAARGGAPRILDRDDLAADTTLSSTTWDVAMTVAFTLERPATVRLRASCRFTNSGANAGVAVWGLFDDSDDSLVESGGVTTVTPGDQESGVAEVLLEDLPAGDYSYSLRHFKSGANGTLTLHATQTYNAVAIAPSYLVAEGHAL